MVIHPPPGASPEMPRCSALTVWKADRETGRGSPRQQAPLWLASQRSWEALGAHPPNLPPWGTGAAESER